jgi:hypothetical protein
MKKKDKLNEKYDKGYLFVNKQEKFQNHYDILFLIGNRFHGLKCLTPSLCGIFLHKGKKKARMTRAFS